MTYRQLFEELRKRCGMPQKASVFVIMSSALDDLTRATDAIPGNPMDWQDKKVGDRGAADCWNTLCEFLWRSAVAFAETTDDGVYQDATLVARTFQEIVQEHFAIDLGEPRRIMSPSRMMAERGLMAVTTDANGEQTVTLTDEGKALAESVRQQVEGKR